MLTVGCNWFIQNYWSGDLHTHTRPLYENWVNEDSSKITASGFLIISLAHLTMLAGQRSGLHLAALPLYPGLPRYLLTDDTQLHLLWQISGWDSRFPLHWFLKASEVSCWWPRTTRTGFYSLLGFVLELGDDTVHSGRWNGQIPGYMLLTCTSLFLTNPLKICEFQRTW